MAEIWPVIARTFIATLIAVLCPQLDSVGSPLSGGSHPVFGYRQITPKPAKGYQIQTLVSEAQMNTLVGEHTTLSYDAALSENGELFWFGRTASKKFPLFKWSKKTGTQLVHREMHWVEPIAIVLNPIPVANCPIGSPVVWGVSHMHQLRRTLEAKCYSDNNEISVFKFPHNDIASLHGVSAISRRQWVSLGRYTKDGSQTRELWEIDLANQKLKLLLSGKEGEVFPEADLTPFEGGYVATQDWMREVYCTKNWKCSRRAQRPIAALSALSASVTQMFTATRSYRIQNQIESGKIYRNGKIIAKDFYSISRLIHGKGGLYVFDFSRTQGFSNRIYQILADSN